MELIKDDWWIEIFESYPSRVQDRLTYLRSLVHETARDCPEITYLQETLKWNEPSFVTNCGSTLRMDWKPKTPHQYALYFQCTSKLVSTFKLVFGKTFNCEGNRAIIFDLDQSIPVKELIACIKACLTYHKVKHLPTLGI